ncbi:hypothetical protein T4A_824 [Trichinella pseudospiralis]|uniref:Uncharacterized protein n=1 Tax=Trichinella pseudospiralis TaxID=6337 RepID=A0A0V1EMI0_TRIPS|nr:hypothetical protein T4A_824 [Trichinella pseudospiralis]
MKNRYLQLQYFAQSLFECLAIQYVPGEMACCPVEVHFRRLSTEMIHTVFYDDQPFRMSSSLSKYRQTFPKLYQWVGKMDLRKLNLGTNLDIQFIPDEVDFVEKKWRRDQTEKHTENAQTGGQNGHRLDVFYEFLFLFNEKTKNYKQNLTQHQQPTGMNYCNSSTSFLNMKCKSQLTMSRIGHLLMLIVFVE